MAKYAEEIACAIDAIKKTENQVACMITFTIPHTSGMSCEETTTILFNTWKNFVVRGNKNLKTSWYAKEQKYSRTGEKVRKFNDKTSKDIFASFNSYFNCKHRIRVGEYTWGENGWHPHFHCLFFVDKNKLQETKQWQEALSARWYQLAMKNTIKVWNQKYPDQPEKNTTRAEIMYAKMDKKGSNGCFISVDKNGKVIEQKSSMYICGWGADRELTGNYKNKASNEGHMSPYQILEKYDETKDEAWLDLYMEYARTIKKGRYSRINFGLSKIREIVKLWKQTNEYQKVLKKKFTNLAQSDAGLWKVICWFTKEQWLQICLIDREIPLKEMILDYARAPDGLEVIRETLEAFSIILNTREPINNDFAFVEKMFNPMYKPKSHFDESVA